MEPLRRLDINASSSIGLSVTSDRGDTLVVVDRYLLSKTWYELLDKLVGRNPTFWDQTMKDIAYKKITSRMMAMSDDELLADMMDIIDSIQFISLQIPGLNVRKEMFNRG